MSTARVGGSFRDPSGFVYTRNGTLYRQIDNSFAEEYDACVDSGLYDALAGDGLLAGHEAAGVDYAATPELRAGIRVLLRDPGAAAGGRLAPVALPHAAPRPVICA